MIVAARNLLPGLPDVRAEDAAGCPLGRGKRDRPEVIDDVGHRDPEPTDPIGQVSLDREDRPPVPVHLHDDSDVPVAVGDKVPRRGAKCPAIGPNGPVPQVPHLNRYLLAAEGGTQEPGLRLVGAESIESGLPPGPGGEGDAPLVTDAVRGDPSLAVSVAGDVVAAVFPHPLRLFLSGQALDLLTFRPDVGGGWLLCGGVSVGRNSDVGRGWTRPGEQDGSPEEYTEEGRQKCYRSASCVGGCEVLVQEGF